MSTTPTELPTGRTPGRTWTVRLTGHADRTATVSCSTGACTMPPRSRDVAALRRFAALHAASHAKAAQVRERASCQCWTQSCAAHEGMRVHCSGSTVLVLRHDPAVACVWHLAEVCAACAKLMTHTRVVGLPAPTTRPAIAAPERRLERSERAGQRAPAPAATAAPAAVAVGFSSPTPTGGDEAPRRAPGQARRGQRSGAARGGQRR
ncbi:hypothetical protein SLUN_01515 [Streptomyces lunaelactis]|uniref:Uncharacterized protein n=1 Tax=Streptomyces lunaelactis TaxID=1535768 RepID=A0A2R4SW96_9ACTN|nr:hypothetical protein [Streptomyces lunaelactis]AVZ71124.1 hypothetical protein SLUN_01515 [Streptomyces lunaelactis]NUK02934.1 hypothetical protein [Streptomyces lunaelactis]NUK11266.1 hypothetical protein [Streptomyces lunaelactis]NUK17145.1 hypothetical protein [Streptomyces lunaelactis]NUK22757.1 hypothetical protein [Streptomyces lunaelactis]